MSAEAFRRARQFLLDHCSDAPTAVREFRWPQLDTFNWALDWFDPYAQGNERPALWVEAEGGTVQKLSFQEMSERSNRVAAYLRELGVQRGDRMLLMLPNDVPIWETMLAAMKLGAVVIPATMLLSEDDLRDRLVRGDVRHIVADSSQASKFEGLLDGQTRIAAGDEVPGWHRYHDAYRADAAFRPDGVTRATDPLLLYFTSGTTSEPKLVLHSHQSYPVGHLSTMYWIGLQEGDVHLNVSSPGWAKHAWSSFFAPWNAGATVFVYQYDRFDAARTLDVLGRCGVTTMCAPPTVWRLLIGQDLAASPVKLREIVSAGEPLNPKVIDALEAAWGIRPRDGYGQTETTAQVANPPGQPLKVGSMGRPLPGYPVVLLDRDGHEIDGEGEGEIALRLGDQRPVALMQEYADDPERTRDALGGTHYRTGDVAARDADGYLTYIGRADDVFKSADYRISPFELESFIIKHEAVVEAAVIPSPHPTRLSVPKAVLVVREGYEPGPELARHIFAYIREHLSPFKRIRRIEFGELPKTISGKIRRVELRSAESGRPEDRRPMEFWEEDFREEGAEDDDE